MGAPAARPEFLRGLNILPGFPADRSECTSGRTRPRRANSDRGASSDYLGAVDAFGVLAVSSSASQRAFKADLRAQRVCLDARAVG